MECPDRRIPKNFPIKIKSVTGLTQATLVTLKALEAVEDGEVKL
ncbi:MAG: hypothetical protein N2235_01275 [Fischerella sp.]|nr:hypothetical protein [Fischerella sp.]